jgi:hypothetical protein
MRNVFATFYILSLSFIQLYSQSLLDQLNSDIARKSDTILVDATFKSTRIISGQSIENVGKGGMNLIISHRFGNINSGIHQFYGLDQSAIRI